MYKGNSLVPFLFTTATVLVAEDSIFCCLWMAYKETDTVYVNYETAKQIYVSMLHSNNKSKTN